MMLYTPSFIAMFGANVCTSGSFAAFFLFPLFVTGHGGSEGEIGIVMGSFAMASAFCRPWVSEMIDRLGRKRSYALGSLAMTILPFVYLLFEGPLSSFLLPLLALRVAHGVAIAICFTAVFTFVADTMPPSRLNEGLGIFGASGLIGMAVGPVLGELVLRGHGFDRFFLLAAALGGTGLLLQAPLRESFRNSARTAGPSFFALLGRRKNLVLGLLSLLFGFGLAATSNFVAPLAEERSLPVISAYYIAYAVAAILVRFTAGRIADRVGENRILPWALAVTGTGIFALVAVTGQLSLTLAGLLAGCGHGLLFPLLNAMAIRDEPAEIRGKLTGIFTGGIDAGLFIGAFCLGYVGEFAGLDALFAVAGSALLAGLWIFRFRPRPAP